MLSPQWRELAPSASEALAMAIRDAVLDGTIRVADRLPAERPPSSVTRAFLPPGDVTGPAAAYRPAWEWPEGQEGAW